MSQKMISNSELLYVVRGVRGVVHDAKYVKELKTYNEYSA